MQYGTVNPEINAERPLGALGPPHLPRLQKSLASHGSRLHLRSWVGSRINTRGASVNVEDASLPGLRLHFELDHAGVIQMTTELERNTPLQLLPPPAITVLAPDASMCVATEAAGDADLEYIDGKLVLPRLIDRSGPEWQYLAMTISQDGILRTAADTRFVEPGVGRTYLADFLHFSDAPKYMDFSVTGVGPTPYSSGGLINIGNHDDGYVPLDRARHRHLMSMIISDAGGRVPRTGAIIVLRNHHRHGPGGSRIPVALLVRGFRNVLRVKQADPIASLMLSRTRWNAIQYQLRLEAQSILKRIPSPGPCRCLTPGIVLGSYPFHKCSTERTCNVLRRAHIKAASSSLISDARERVALEILGVANAEALPTREYLGWFSKTLGKQLGILRTHSMLHDYRVATGDDASGERFNSLTDTNVTLAAELPDLDTVIGLNHKPEYNHSVFGITKQQQDAMAKDFIHYHRRELNLAFGVVRTLAIVTEQLDSNSTQSLRLPFSQGYAEACGQPAW